MTTKKILNYHEEKTDRALKKALEHYGARLFNKVRMADVLDLDGSGLRERPFQFAMRAHFDFVVADTDHQPQFAVEFDGPSHESARQQERDGLKDTICEQVTFPLLRVNRRWIDGSYRGVDLMSWTIHRWYAEEAMHEAYEIGVVREDFDPDPVNFITWNGFDNSERFPFDLGMPVRAELIRRAKRGEIPCRWGAVSVRWPNDDLTGAAWIFRADGETAYAEERMRAQNFPMDAYHVVQDLALHRAMSHLDAEMTISESKARVRLARLREAEHWPPGGAWAGDPLFD